jgi:MFS family permease
VRLFIANRTFAFSNLAALINYSATAAVAFLLSLYLQYAKGLSPQSAGLVLMVQPAFQALLSPSAGKLSDRIEPGIIASLGMALTALGLFMLSMLELHTSLCFVALSLSCLGVGFALFSSPNTNAIMSSVSREYYGIASGSLATMRLLGQMTSLALATVLFAFTMGQAQIGPGNLHVFVKSVNTAFIISAILCAIGIYFSYARGKLHNV